MMKVPSSFSSDPLLHDRQRDFEVSVRYTQVSAGAGFLITVTGRTMLMPGLSKRPMDGEIDLLPDDALIGVG